MTEKAPHSPGPWHTDPKAPEESFFEDVSILRHDGLAVGVAVHNGDIDPATVVSNAEVLAAAPDLLRLAGEAWGALNFILAFYEPGQRYLDTEAWKQAEASGRRVHAALREKLDALPEAPK